MKTCSKCGIEKSLNEFHKKKDSKDGVTYLCKICAIQKTKDYYEKNKQEINDKRRKNYMVDREKIAKMNTCWRKNNKEKVRKSKKKYHLKNRDKNKLYLKEWHKNNKDIVKKNKEAYQRTLAKYTLGKSIAWHDPIECDINGYLIVKCKYCGKKFTPIVGAVFSRAAALNTIGKDSNGFYCSSGCKKACPTYNQKSRYKGAEIDSSSREVQPQLRQMCLARDNYTCQKCNANGKTIQLHCHHIKAVAEDPLESADIDNTITYCKACHKQAHQIPGCKYHELRCA